MSCFTGVEPVETEKKVTSDPVILNIKKTHRMLNTSKKMSSILVTQTIWALKLRNL